MILDHDGPGVGVIEMGVGMVVSWSGRWCQDDVVAEGLELGDEVAGFAGLVDTGGVVVGAER